MQARDDLSIYWRQCHRCLARFHVAEPFCNCPDGTKDCRSCDETFIDEDDDREHCDECTDDNQV